MEPDSKKPWQSRTNWVALLLAVAAFFPAVQSIVKQNPDITLFGVSVVFAFLRMITKGRISIS